MKRYIFADTETTDAGPDAAVCEIGWIEADENFNEISRIESLIDPQKPIDPAASGVHGLIYKDVEHAPTLDEFFHTQLEGCFGSLLEGDIVLIGHNISFDSRFFKPYIPGRLTEVCTLRWSRKLYPDLSNHKLSTLKYAAHLPRGNGDSHRVMTDVEDAKNLASHICRAQGMTLPELVERSQEPMLIEYVSFGKHKGDRFANVPKAYLRWMANNFTDMDMDTAHTVAYYLSR